MDKNSDLSYFQSKISSEVVKNKLENISYTIFGRNS